MGSRDCQRSSSFVELTNLRIKTWQQSMQWWFNNLINDLFTVLLSLHPFTQFYVALTLNLLYISSLFLPRILTHAVYFQAKVWSQISSDLTEKERGARETWRERRKEGGDRGRERERDEERAREHSCKRLVFNSKSECANLKWILQGNQCEVIPTPAL